VRSLDLPGAARNGLAMNEANNIETGAAASTGGILPGHAIEALAASGAITSARPFVEGQIQPASLDLRLGSRAYRVRASFLPGPLRSVEERLSVLGLHEIDLERGAVLETNTVYIAEIEEHLALPAGLSAAANPKSSTGRLDVFTRIITDRTDRFDLVAQGYAGKLYAEVSPRTFPVLVRRGSRLAQLRLRSGEARLDDDELVRRWSPGARPRSPLASRSASISPAAQRSSAIGPRTIPASSMSTASAPMRHAISGTR